jgi:hypothetical protein
MSRSFDEICLDDEAPLRSTPRPIIHEYKPKMEIGVKPVFSIKTLKKLKIALAAAAHWLPF